MTRRIRPPKHPVTGHPFVDNELRNDWRARRNFLRTRPAKEILLSLHFGGHVWLWEPRSKPRKNLKWERKAAYRGAFRYHPADYYTPERMILNDSQSPARP